MFKVKMIVSGRVQGVGFRYFVIISARELGILGRIWNNDDGTVGILAQTDDSQKLEEFTALIRGEKSFQRSSFSLCESNLCRVDSYKFP